jgi:hypothetical protein
MRVSEEPVCIDLFRQNPIITSLHLRSPVHVVPPLNNESLGLPLVGLKRGAKWNLRGKQLWL